MRSHALTVVVDCDRDIAAMTALAADMARLAALEPDVDLVHSVSVHSWDDDDDDDSVHDIPVDVIERR